MSKNNKVLNNPVPTDCFTTLPHNIVTSSSTPCAAGKLGRVARNLCTFDHHFFAFNLAHIILLSVEYLSITHVLIIGRLALKYLSHFGSCISKLGRTAAHHFYTLD